MKNNEGSQLKEMPCELAQTLLNTSPINYAAILKIHKDTRGTNEIIKTYLDLFLGAINHILEIQQAYGGCNNKKCKEISEKLIENITIVDSTTVLTL